MNTEISIGKKVYIPTPSHGFVSAEVTDIKKDNINRITSVSVKYIEDFIKETYGSDDIIYIGSNIEKIVIKPQNSERPFYWLFQNRKDFPKWVTDTFMKYSSCDKNIKEKKEEIKEGFEFLPRQKFIRDYLSHESPYRGLLLYHGLGTGKTCASIAVSENLKDNRNIVILLPASLEENFKKDGLKKCGSPKYQNTDGNKLINEKYTFISHDSPFLMKQLEELGSLNNKIIIVDEAHRLATKIVNGLRGSGKQGVEVYKMLLEAKNSKIVLLTGTPLVNTPFEIAVLFNILRGLLEIIVFRISDFREENIDDYIEKLISDERIGWVEVNRRNQSLLAILKLNSWDMEFEQTIRFIESTARNYNAYVNFERTDKYTLFPEKEEEFESFFIKDDNFINKDMFQRRIVGLTSYFETTEETKKEFPEQLPEKIIKVQMSPHQYELYQKARDFERPIERRAAQKMRRNKAQKISTTARVFSREFSNFVFPDEIERPFKKIKFLTSKMEEKKERNSKLKGENYDEILELEKKIEKTKETLNKEIKESLEKLVDPEKPYLKPGPNGLSRYSPKMEAMLKEIKKDSQGLVLVYSSFRTVEGLEIFSRVLEANGYQNFNIKNKNDNYDFKRFAFYSGQEDMKTRKKIVDTYTNSDNKYGKNLRILLVSSAGAEGLDLKNIRKVLIMDVFWHDVRIQQIIGRAVRKKSHYDLPENERNVQPIIYLSVFTQPQKETSAEKISTDEYIYDLSKKKLRLNNDVLDAVKESAIDCMLNQCDNQNKCYRFLGEKKGLAFLPKIQDDIVYGYKHAHVKEIQKEFVVAGITESDEIVYKKENKWFLGNGKKLNKKPEIIKNKKFGLDLGTLELFDYNSIKNKGVQLKIGTVNELDGKFNQ